MSRYVASVSKCESIVDSWPDTLRWVALRCIARVCVQAVKRERFPTPRYVECDQGTSQARFVSAIVDPSVTHMSMNQAGGEAVLTEDVNLEVFMEHLKKLAVQS